MRISRSLCCLGLACSLWGCSWGPDPAPEAEETRGPGICHALYLEGAYDRAFPACSGLEEPEALYETAQMYARGRGTPADHPRARRLMQKAAAAGHVRAMYELGLMYDAGIGGRADFQEAFRWYRQAAEKGHEDAMNSLGLMYSCGDGVAKDPESALRWHLTAAGKGSGRAMFHVGRLLEDGLVPPERLNGASPEDWYRKAAERQYPEAVFLLARKSYLRGKDSRSRGEIERAAYLGSAAAAVFLGDLALKERKDPMTAFCWYSLGEAGGSSAAAEKRRALASGWKADRLERAAERCGSIR